jgi:hypothetical protein
LIERPGQVGSKFLRKHESVPLCRFVGHSNGTPIGNSRIALFEDNAGTIAHSSGTRFRLPTVNHIGKGLRPGAIKADAH